MVHFHELKPFDWYIPRILDLFMMNNWFQNHESSILCIFEFMRIQFGKMERMNRQKPLTAEMKGSLITLYQNGNSYQEIAQRLNIHVSKKEVLNLLQLIANNDFKQITIMYFFL